MSFLCWSFWRSFLWAFCVGAFKKAFYELFVGAFKEVFYELFVLELLGSFLELFLGRVWNSDLQGSKASKITIFLHPTEQILQRIDQKIAKNQLARNNLCVWILFFPLSNEKADHENFPWTFHLIFKYMLTLHKIRNTSIKYKLFICFDIKKT